MPPTNETLHIDCLEYMRSLPDNHFDLLIADPPYGLDKKSTQGRGRLKNRILNKDSIHDWDVAPSAEVFAEMRRVSKNQIIWGGNYFPLPPTRCFVCWDKMQPWENFSQCEFAWTSFSYPAKMFRFDNRTTQKIHPTQKPVELYAYLLRIFAKEGDTVFDPFLGSGSSSIAAYKMGFDFVGCEIDERFYSLSVERFNQECLGFETSASGHTIKQLSLFSL